MLLLALLWSLQVRLEACVGVWSGGVLPQRQNHGNQNRYVSVVAIWQFHDWMSLFERSHLPLVVASEFVLCLAVAIAKF
eukprot:2497765-Amphidinium_carterae.1